MSFIKDTVVDEETPCWFEIWLLKIKEHVRRKFRNSISPCLFKSNVIFPLDTLDHLMISDLVTQTILDINNNNFNILLLIQVTLTTNRNARNENLVTWTCAL